LIFSAFPGISEGGIQFVSTGAAAIQTGGISAGGISEGAHSQAFQKAVFNLSQPHFF
jgi:hypothetical protein